ncbi:MAG: DUF882 domain-containing protein [Gammaproteobacteria bacterium]|nr:DUF882 domain-containing protein [Gammaproteobacteria bacterium]MCW8841108.1 DUF882 domain-containing protein [Gammaproteobacteria bacterium]MCW8972321.1 DUF882 domain-containing protein [Gammaproteobacteria bacterium]MCW8992709.1 DUF882 domain-containing protein [Gammaproteobacteria bacterium]
MISRRIFLQGAVAATVAVATPGLHAAVASADAERRLNFYNLHTGERLSATFWADGHYVAEELAAIDHLLRDHRRNEVEAIDTRLLEQLHTLQRHFGKHDTFHVISGYRSPQTNAALNSRSSGVAKRSLHMQGRAIDIRLPGVELKSLRQAALAQKAGGVGYYPKSDFIHLDTGRPRFW